MHARILLVLVWCLFSAPMLSNAQSLEEYQKQEAARMQKFATDQQEGMAKLQKEYADYVAKRDQEWTDYLKKEWANYKANAGQPVPEKPKPQKTPLFTPVANKPVVAGTTDQPVKSSGVSAASTTEATPAPVSPTCKPAVVGTIDKSVNLNFYGRNFNLGYDPRIAQLSVGTTINQQAIGSFWEKASAVNYTPMVEQLQQLKSDLNTNDYGYLLLVQNVADKLYPNSKSTARLLSWFILVRSGYSVRIGFLNNEVALLIPTSEQIFQKNYLLLQGIRYYIFPELQSASFYTYDKDYQTGKMFDFRIAAPMNLAGRKVEKTLSFDFEGKPLQVTVQYDPDLIEFFRDYPTVGFEVYFDAAMSVTSKESLLAALKPLIEGMDEARAANLILRFVQTAFGYKTDPEQFGREKYFFAEEVFYYPYCDCEDRSVLFSYLVRELLGLKTIGLEYPGHMSTAVAFASEQTGEYLVFNNDRYVIADPTFINAPVGMAMPEFKSVAPIVHPLADHSVAERNNAALWAKAMEGGCYKGSSRKNSKLLPSGETLLTGYFSDHGRLGAAQLTGTSNTHNCFVAKMNRQGEVVWVKTLSSSGNAVGMSVDAGPTGNIVVVGVFTGNMDPSGKNLSSASGKSDLFVASYTSEGNLQWINRGGLERLPSDNSTAFSVQFDPIGNKLATTHAGQVPEEANQGLFLKPDGSILYNGMVNYAMAVSGNDVQTAYAAAANADIFELIKSEKDKLISQQSDRAMSGLLGALKVVKDMGMSLTGVQAQEAINKQNPALRTSCPNIYKNLGMINFVKNAKGIITIQTMNGKDIGFDKVKVTNNSTVTVSELPGGIYKLDVLSGIRVGKAIIWFDLNFIKLFAKNGNLLFDYSNDHSQASVNLTKDILN